MNRWTNMRMDGLESQTENVYEAITKIYRSLRLSVAHEDRRKKKMQRNGSEFFFINFFVFFLLYFFFSHRKPDISTPMIYVSDDVVCGAKMRHRCRFCASHRPECQLGSGVCYYCYMLVRKPVSAQRRYHLYTLVQCGTRH